MLRLQKEAEPAPERLGLTVPGPESFSPHNGSLPSLPTLFPPAPTGERAQPWPLMANSWSTVSPAVSPRRDGRSPPGRGHWTPCQTPH